MNIFVLDLDPVIAASYHNDKHCVKMILEYAQLLSSAHHSFDTEYKDQCYKLTHKNHPCAVWVRESSANYVWLFKLFEALCHEYTKRYGKMHKTYVEKCSVFENVPNGYTNHTMTEFPQAVTESCKHHDTVTAYREYYIKEKSHIGVWKTRIPLWYADKITPFNF